MLTQSDLKMLVEYDPDTGKFIRLKTTGPTSQKGDVLGRSPTGYGYLSVMIDGKNYLLHRLAFLYMTGEFPQHGVDHLNRVRDDNRWTNLRDVPQSVNVLNSGLRSNNKSGVTGVSWNKRSGKWSAQLKIKGKNVHHTLHDLLDDAIAARLEAESTHRPMKNGVS